MGKRVSLEDKLERRKKKLKIINREPTQAEIKMMLTTRCYDCKTQILDYDDKKVSDAWLCCEMCRRPFCKECVNNEKAGGMCMHCKPFFM